MILDGEGVDRDRDLFGVNGGKLLLSAAIFVEFVQHVVRDDLWTIAAKFFDSLRVRIELEHAW